MPDNYEMEQKDRDTHLISRAAAATENLGQYIYNWVAEETRGLIFRADVLEATVSEETTDKDKARIHEVCLQIREVNARELDEAYNRLQERIEEIETGDLYTDPLEAHQYLQDALSGLERLARKLRGLRVAIDGAWSQGSQ